MPEGHKSQEIPIVCSRDWIGVPSREKKNARNLILMMG